MTLKGDVKPFHLKESFLLLKQTAKTLITRSVASDLGLHCCLMSQSRFYR